MTSRLPVLLLAALAPLGLLPPAHCAAAPGQPPEQWCPRQPWDLEWGANWDVRHCHSAENPEEDNNTDLDGNAPPEYGAPPGGSEEPEENSRHDDEGSSSAGHDIGGRQQGGRETGN